MDELVRIVENAGNHILRNLRRFGKVEVKSSHSDLVTEIDKQVEDMIRVELSRYDIDVIGEESWKGEKVRSGIFAMVDPIDGTLNFVHGLNFFAVSVAIFENEDVIMGVVHSPMLGETFYASQDDENAYMNGEPIKPSNTLDLRNSIFVTGWPYDRDMMSLTMKTIARMMEEVQEVRILGSAALELCYVGMGRMDGYWEFGLEPWDVAAGAFIAKKAGAKVSGINTEDYLETSQILATTPGIYEMSRKILREVS